jgi:hypothetical protein
MISGQSQSPQIKQKQNMNKKKGSVIRLFSALLVFSLAALLISCNEDENQLGFTDSQNVASEASVDSYFEDAEDISSTAAMAPDIALGGRAAGLDDRFCDNVKVKLMKKSLANSDTIVIDFGTGCTDPRGNIRKGKIIIIFTGARLQIGNSITITFENFSVNDVKIEGTRTVKLTSVDPITHEITLENGKVTWPDQTSATRTAHHFRKWDTKGTLDRADDEVLLLTGGTAAGNNRNGKTYDMQILKDIVFKVTCFKQRRYLPVAGEKLIEIDGKSLLVNFGEGECDNVIKVTIDGVTKEVTVDRR